jgi:hypothetical protein
MLEKANLGSYQYMVDVGVPQEDVLWLRLIANTPSARMAHVAARIRRIQDQAYKGLLSASLPARQPAYQ